MKKNNLNLVLRDLYLVLIALTPTEEAQEKNTVFSRDEVFWNSKRCWINL
jgi:hypothetical protein